MRTNSLKKIIFALKSDIPLRIGFDIHGVIDSDPLFFSYLIRKLSENHKIYIITGNSKTKNIVDYLKSWDIKYDFFFSIADHLNEQCCEVEYTNANNPWFDDELWDKQKGIYCKENSIDIHFDDTERYEKYFDKIITEFILINN